MFKKGYFDGKSSPKIYDFATQNVSYYGLFLSRHLAGRKQKFETDGDVLGVDNYIYHITSKGMKKAKKVPEFVVTHIDTRNNSSGGFRPTIYFFNNSNKKIKYVYYDVSAKNRVDDILENRWGESSFTLKSTGPFDGRSVGCEEFEPFIYDKTAEDLVINSVKIEYMDGKVKTLKGKDVYYYVEFIDEH